MKIGKTVFDRDEMFRINCEKLAERGVKIEQIAEVAYKQQSRYNSAIKLEDCVKSVEKILSLRDTFHILLIGVELDKLAEQGKLSSPLNDILVADLGMFGVDEILGLEIAGNYGVIGRTNFGDIDVNKPGIVNDLNETGKKGVVCHTFLDDIVGAIAAAASTRVAQELTENIARGEVSKK